jgi:flagellar hook-basal body complex protein FliE
VINPLDALSALTQAQSSAAGQMPGMPNVTGFQPTGTLPTGATNPLSETFNLLHPIDATQASQAASQASAPLAPMSSGGGASTWGHMVQQMVMDVNSKQATAAQKVTDVLNGGPTPVHEAMVATEEASLSFEFLAEMRNKVVESYQTVMQMQV